MEHTTNDEMKINENSIETDAALEAQEGSEQTDKAISEEISSQQQVSAGEGAEEWDLHPAFPNEDDLLYPGQDKLELEFDYLDDEKQENTLWQARTGLDFETLCGAIETVIFMSDKPVSINKIKNLIDEDMPLRILHESIVRLQEEYESRHHGLRLVEVAEGYQFRTKATYSKYVQDLFKVNSLVLSPTALEVLAILSYKQPVSKTEVDKIRGVDSGHIVRGLMDKRLVKVVGRSDEMGRPVLYGTTPEFLEVFNLASLNELPPEHELEESIENNVGKISDIKTIVHEGDKERFVFDDIDELDSLAASIKEIASDTSFTHALKTSEKEKLKAKSTSDETDAPKVASAFDILEDYVSKQMIIDANNDAGNSEMMTSSADPRVISNIDEGPFNTPESEEEEDSFQMIDLDTGLPIEEDETSNDIEEFSLTGADLLEDSDEEAAALSKALDDAFERLTGEKLEEDDEKAHVDVSVELEGELGLREKELDEKEDCLEEKAQLMADKARDLDLDLDFLKEVQDNSSASDENNTDQQG